ncbi:MAG: hypothetical protein AAGE01_10265 [Pseudomonadota bacterium]
MKRIRSTVPPLTYGGTRERLSRHAIYLRLSHLEIEKRRRASELALVKQRLAAISQRMATLGDEIDHLKALESRVDESFEVEEYESPDALKIEY